LSNVVRRGPEKLWQIVHPEHWQPRATPVGQIDIAVRYFPF
jgi:hypothetical protein